MNLILDMYDAARVRVANLFMKNFGVAWLWGFVFYWLYLGSLEVIKRKLHLDPVVVTFSSTYGGAVGAMLVAVLGDMLRTRDVYRVVPRWMMVMEGFSTGIIVVVTGLTMSQYGFVAAVLVMASLKAITVPTSWIAKGLLKLFGFTSPPKPEERLKSLWDDILSTAFALAGLAIMGYATYTGKLEHLARTHAVVKQADTKLLIWFGVGIVVYGVFSAYRQFLAGYLRYRVRVLKIEGNDIYFCAFGTGQTWWSLVFSVGTIVFALVRDYVFHLPHHLVVPFNAWAFLAGLPFGFMALFAVMIMTMNAKTEKSLQNRTVSHKGMGTLAGFLVTVIDGYQHNNLPNWQQWLGVGLVFIAIAIPLITFWVIRAQRQMPKWSAAIYNFRLQHNLFL
jgi:hypothetical protein